jgi:hypothetical protein
VCLLLWRNPFRFALFILRPRRIMHATGGECRLLRSYESLCRYLA